MKHLPFTIIGLLIGLLGFFVDHNQLEITKNAEAIKRNTELIRKQEDKITSFELMLEELPHVISVCPNCGKTWLSTTNSVGDIYLSTWGKYDEQ